MDMEILQKIQMGVSKKRGGPPKSSILIGFSIINHAFWGTIIFGNTQMLSQGKMWPCSWLEIANLSIILQEENE